MRRPFFLFITNFITALACAQQPDFSDDVPLDVYLDALAHISPAAREGANHYIQAFQIHCGRRLTTLELRRAVAIGDGNPVLMGMIRAAHQKNAQVLRSLGATISCPRQGQ